MKRYGFVERALYYTLCGCGLYSCIDCVVVDCVDFCFCDAAAATYTATYQYDGNNKELFVGERERQRERQTHTRRHHSIGGHL